MHLPTTRLRHALFATLLVAYPARAAVRYAVQPLDDLVGNYENGAVAINDAGDVVGYGYAKDDRGYRLNVLLWRQGVATVVAEGSWFEGGVTAINTSGTVVGSVSVGDPYSGDVPTTFPASRGATVTLPCIRARFTPSP